MRIPQPREGSHGKEGEAQDDQNQSACAVQRGDRRFGDDRALVGGLYGVSVGGAFFGESMFSRSTDASKIALVHLAARLIAGGYILLDAQFHNPHLEQFGLIELAREDFQTALQIALRKEGDFYSLGSKGSESVSGETALHWITQMS